MKQLPTTKEVLEGGKATAHTCTKCGFTFNILRPIGFVCAKNDCPTFLKTTS